MSVSKDSQLVVKLRLVFTATVQYIRMIIITIRDKGRAGQDQRKYINIKLPPLTCAMLLPKS